ncbi:MAG: hypothetical protein HYT93_04420 [Parcubacteria group bacterium]|nr:hypothetical protein [Parcubacteria group bacterium]
MTSQKIKFVFVGLFLAALFILIFFLSGANIPQVTETFEECLRQGNAVMESYPRQCRDKEGNLFIEHIGNELEKINLIRLETPRPNEIIKSPLIIIGEARGYWFFEASFPVVLTDWDGKIIAEHYAEAQDDPEVGSADGASWMTEDFVPFKTELQFENPSSASASFRRDGLDADFSKHGTLILRKDNPSGLPEHDDALEIPIFFE